MSLIRLREWPCFSRILTCWKKQRKQPRKWPWNGTLLKTALMRSSCLPNWIFRWDGGSSNELWGWPKHFKKLQMFLPIVVKHSLIGQLWGFLLKKVIMIMQKKHAWKASKSEILFTEKSSYPEINLLRAHSRLEFKSFFIVIFIYFYPRLN